ncbi:sulfotransferase [Alcanivorax sp. DP30]|uniref:tetratricopeptide repeat-containing sulfotransferase family protein n=1 Tax=Alcanivorax sp. DP30 TaxID=2606217 RepID=UPI001371AB33|nr:sulfotransferase [Alcanivorax sp. DP30]MZR61848.1 hypothetical protein [Alcanivorax sp. DP30]
MKQVLTAKELPSSVKILCEKGDYKSASQLVLRFVAKGYVDYGAADFCFRSALGYDDVQQIYDLAEPIVRVAPKDWRSWQLMYQAYHADARWQDALTALSKVRKWSDSINAEYFLARAEAYERLLDPDSALKELAELDKLNDKGAESRALLLWGNVQLQKKNYKALIDQLPQRLNGKKADRYMGGVLKVLGKALDAKGEYGAAFSAATKGNQIQSKIESRLVSKNAIRRRVEVFRTLFTKDWVGSWSELSSPSRTPVFMLGFPRSGTTLLEQVLDSHPEIQAMEEPPTMATVLRQSTSWMQAMATQAGLLHKSSGWKSQWLSVMDYIKAIGEEQVRGFRETYFKVVDQELQLRENSVLIEKMPLNTVDIGLILRLFPDAKFIVSLRHPADCVLSGYMQNFKMNDAMANFLDLDNAASFYKHVMKLLWQYEEVFDLKDRMHYIRYEDLVMDLEGEARKALDFLGLPWDDAVLNYDEHAKQRGTLATPSYQGVTQKIYDSSKERWRNYAEWMAPVLPHFKEAAERYGYDLSL